MKKLLSLLSIFSLSCANTMPLIGCGNIASNKVPLSPNNLENDLKVNLKTNIDLEKRYLPHPILIQQRGYKGTFFNQYKTDNIKNLTNTFLSKADSNLEIKFKTEFSNYEQLQGYLKTLIFFIRPNLFYCFIILLLIFEIKQILMKF